MDNPIIIGCNYHTTWQSHKAMRFVLAEIKGDKARLYTRRTKKIFGLMYLILFLLKQFVT